MSKTSKNGLGTGGDERNTQSGRNKATTSNLSTKASSSSATGATLADKQNDNDTVNRSKPGGAITKPNLTAAGKSNIKSKLRSPAKVGLGQQPTNRVNRSNIVSSNKEIIKTASDNWKLKRQTTKMKPTETESVDKKQKILNAPIDSIIPEESGDNQQNNETNHAEEPVAVQQENGNTNGFDGKEVTMESDGQNETKENGKAEQNEVISEINEKEEDEINLHLELEENCTKSDENIINDTSDANKDNNSQNELKHLTEGTTHENLQTDTESCSVDVVESTTSEVSETTELTAPSEHKDKDNENQDENNDAVLFDSNIMLKDVQVKLNDCLKDNKSEDESNVDQSPEYAHKEATFGKTLRTLSGRNSIGRMRHITLRDRQPSPNSSLFVNTSSSSILGDSPSDYKILRHRNTLSELPSSNNGTPIDKKRKLIEDSSNALKKPKTEESSSSLLNTSLEYLKYPFGFRRPVQVSTPYKVQTEKHNISASEEVKVMDEQQPGVVQKWCVIM